MTAKYTPVWCAFTDDGGSKPHTNIIGYTPSTHIVFSLPGHHKDEAAVRLIAAAPALLAACRSMLAERSGAAQLSNACIAANEAITKATGGVE